MIKTRPSIPSLRRWIFTKYLCTGRGAPLEHIITEQEWIGREKISFELLNTVGMKRFLYRLYPSLSPIRCLHCR